jgi:NADH-quinone oxidoreductase subunit E
MEASAGTPVQGVVERIVQRNHSDPAMLIAMLQDVQEECNYLPKDALTLLAHLLQVPLTRVYSVASFYRAFSLKPRGRHLIQVCLGTACHVRGGPRILEQICRVLNVKTGDTTEDGEFTIEDVHCVGACALGPVIAADGAYYGRMTVGKVSSTLATIREGGTPEATRAAPGKKAGA